MNEKHTEYIYTQAYGQQILYVLISKWAYTNEIYSYLRQIYVNINHISNDKNAINFYQNYRETTPLYYQYLW